MAIPNRPARLIGDDDAGHDHERRQRRRLERHGKALDDIGAVAGDRGLGDRLHRTVVGAGVILGDDDDQSGDHQPDRPAIKQRLAGEGHVSDLHGGVHADQPGGQRVEQDERENAGREHALIERAHDRLARAQPYEIGADDRGDHARRADGERVDHHLHDAVAAGEIDRGEHHGGDDGHDIGLEQIGGHAGAVADIVANVVGDGRRVARVILGDAGLDLADQVAADIGALGEDAAAETGEDGDERGAKAERDERVDHLA